MILVLVCMFMVSMIGAMILSTTLINYKMKIIQKQKADNFYSAEAVMEELSVRVRQHVLDAYRLSYEDLLLHYLDTEVANDRQVYFMKRIAETLGIQPEKSLSLGEEIYVSKELGDFADIKNEINVILGADGALSFAPIDTVRVDVRKQEIRLQEVRLEFRDENGMETVIETDIVLVVAMPDDSFSTAGVQVNRYVDDYVVIANGNINANSSGTGGAGKTNAVVNGSMYSGKNLEVAAGLTVQGKRIVLGESLVLPYGSSLTAFTGTADSNGIWVRNIELDGGSMYLNGDCYVADDTTFSEEKSELTIQGGGYYGYSYSDAIEGNPAMSSAILINKPNITLDLSEANMLWLAGNAYIREEKLFDSLSSAFEAEDGVLEGESLAYKNLQAAYLLPGSCLVGVEHNPILISQNFTKKRGEVLEHAYMISESGKKTEEAMTVVEDMVIGHQAYSAGSTVPADTALPVGTVLPAKTKLPCDVSTPIVEMMLNTKGGKYFTEDGYYINLKLSQSVLGIDISQYTDADNPFIVRYSNTKKTAYYYMRFLNPQKASEYFYDLSQTVSGNALLKQLSTLGSSYILLPADSNNIVTVGNLTRYSSESEYGIVPESKGSNLWWKESLLTSSYNSLLQELSPGGKLESSVVPVSSSELDMFGHLIDPVRLAQADSDDSDPDPEVKKILKTVRDALGNEIQLYVEYHSASDDFTITTTNMQNIGALTNAVIITNGNVQVDTAFTGLILAKGDVMLKISGEGERLESGIGIADLLSNPEIGPYFKAYQAPEEGKDKIEYLKMTELIQMSYEEWRKN